MAGRIFGQVAKEGAKHGRSSQHLRSTVDLPSTVFSPSNAGVSLLKSLTDPFLQDVDHDSRRYISYFASDVCRDLVLYDSPKHNPFRELIPLAHQSSALLQVIIANAALHMSNACHKSLVLKTATPPPRHHTSTKGSPRSKSCATQSPGPYKDALAAKQRALHLLKSALADLASTDIDATLAVVLLLVDFELIDSGQDNWRHHINGARTIIEICLGSNATTCTAMSPLRSSLISNYLVFDILGSALASPTDHGPGDAFPTSTLSLCQDAEGNHCSSFPRTLLQLLQTGAQLFRHDDPSSTTLSSKQRRAFSLLSTAQSFDPLAWATNIQSLSPATDLLHRAHIASAHRAAVCIYLSRVLLSFDATAHLSESLESLVAHVITHLSHIRPSDALFKAITWPAFIAGAETHDQEKQEWVARRFEELWQVEPWGLIRGALEVLERIWKGRRTARAVNEKQDNRDWIEDLRRTGVDWLVI